MSPPPTPAPSPPVSAAPDSRAVGPNAKRHLRNYLLDARFQLKFTAYIVVIALCVATLLGALLWSTSKRLMEEAEVAVLSSQRAVESTKELKNATLSNTVMEHMNDPAWEAKVEEESAKIEADYESEKAKVVQQRVELVRQQNYMWLVLVGSMIGFVLFIGVATIVTTHHIVGPLFRIKRLINDVATGRLKVPEYPLRDGDELKDVFDAVTKMVRNLRDRQTEDVQAVSTMVERAARSKAALELVPGLQELESKLRARLD